MFAQPRLKKDALRPPPPKKRKAEHAIEEIAFDNAARADYLTGFHKRKQHRIKQAQEIAAQKARQEKIELRKQIRDERKQALEEHVEAVSKILDNAQAAGQDTEDQEQEKDVDEWDGFEDEPVLEPVDHEEEYVDEDRYTTVTVESVNIDREGIHKPGGSSDEGEEDDDTADGESATGTSRGKSEGAAAAKPRKEWPKKKKKFRYETKLERRLTETKARNKKRS